MIFAFDKIIKGTPVPNCATHFAQPGTAEWSRFSSKYPFSEPVHFLEYLRKENVEFDVVYTNSAPNTAIYPISVSFFDFTVKWFKIMDLHVVNRIKNKQLKVWFLYSEGDDPFLIKNHLFSQAEESGIEWSQIHFTSANSSAIHIENFSYFADDELLYALRNTDAPVLYHDNPRPRKFTALSRVHKAWRASTMASIWSKGFHHDGYFSYSGFMLDSVDENPLDVDTLPGLENITKEFLANCPFKADTLDSNTHNDHSFTVREHFENSYLNLVLETHLTTHNDSGVFVSEKVFKPIKNNQLFIVIGCCGTIELLKDMGYKTFENVIDHGYDLEPDHTKRWLMALQEFEILLNCDLHSLYKSCKADLEHNMKLFTASKKQTLNTLLQKVINDPS